MPDKKVNHEGIVKAVTDQYVEVSILAKAACLSCQLKGVCSVSDLEEKVIEVPKISNNAYKAGEKVEVEMKESLGVKALLLGYVYPFLLVLIVLIVTYASTGKQGLAGLLAVGSLVPYYFILYLLKNKFRKIFTFSIK